MTEEFRNALPAGTVIDTYQIEKILGVGGFGITYLVRELNLGKLYAIKELLPDGIAIRQGGETTVMARSTSDQDNFDATRKYFISEAQVLAGMSHPAVVSVHRLMEANGTCYMVMDYVEGDTLGDHLKKRGGVLSGADEFKQIFYPLMSGLEILHDQGIIHRDIKPGNIMVKPDGSPVLLDFGAATQVQSKTMTITQMLSAGYSPFEQYTSRAKQGPYTDIYALGATMLKCITGEKPDDASDRVYGDAYQSLLETSKYVTTYGSSILSAVDASLQMDASQRPKNIAEWWAVMSGDGGGSTSGGESDDRSIASKSQPVKELSQQDAEAGQGLVREHEADSLARKLRALKSKNKVTILVVGGIVSVVLILFRGMMIWNGGLRDNEDRSVTQEVNVVDVTEKKKPQKDTRLEALETAQDLFDAGLPFPSDFSDKVDQNDLKSLAEDGNAQAQYLWGVAHDSVMGILTDDREAVKWYRKAADQGYAIAQNHLGFLYETGRGVSKNEAEAAIWYGKAADQGFMVAQCNLGVVYEAGRGVSRDEREAVRWYRKSAEQG